MSDLLLSSEHQLCTARSEDNYKYLGLLGISDILHSQVQETVTNEYTRKIRNIINTKISGRNTIAEINAFAIPGLRYGFGMVRWSKDELLSLDCKTRKLTVKTKFHHVKLDMHRLYLHQRYRGKGLIGVWDCHQQECTALDEYMQLPIKDYLVNIVRESEIRTQCGIMYYITDSTKGINAKQINEEQKIALREMQMHGHLWRQQKELPQFDAIRYVNWIHTANL